MDICVGDIPYCPQLAPIPCNPTYGLGGLRTLLAGILSWILLFYLIHHRYHRPSSYRDTILTKSIGATIYSREVIDRRLAAECGGISSQEIDDSRRSGVTCFYLKLALRKFWFFDRQRRVARCNRCGSMWNCPGCFYFWRKQAKLLVALVDLFIYALDQEPWTSALVIAIKVWLPIEYNCTISQPQRSRSSRGVTRARVRQSA